MGTIFVDNLEPQSGTSLTLGASGDTVKVASGVTNNVGIAMADQWRLTSNKTNNQEPLSADLEQVDGSGQGTLGSAMTQSSGVFTFPSTGIYLVKFQAGIAVTGAGTEESDGNIQIQVTTDNSSYNTRAGAKFSLHYNNVEREDTVSTETLVDVTDTSNVKVKFFVTAVTSAVTTRGDSNENKTFFTFIRLGDT
jgi:hypothetical protein